MNKDNIMISIANQMIKFTTNTKSVKKEHREIYIKENFVELNLAYSLFPTMPSAFQAAVANALKTKHRDKVIQFCKDFKENKFKGDKDPVFLLWRFMKRADKSPNNLYPAVSFALKSYIENSEIRSIRSDRSKKLV